MIGALIAKPAIDSFRTRFDPRRYNGAMFLGLGGICVKSHGGTDGLGFFHAIKVAHELVVDNLNEGIKEDYARFSSEHHVIMDTTSAD
jgi:glycerol-3-phosphate acyltransferase PlsX